ncbi:MAG: acyl-CoA dehydrogenase family protein [Chloroflexi bacterium]|nr:acyl-CoA dehydrogenase family protein [Chloroflexota bacterium]
MDWNDSGPQSAFRAEVREFLDERLPAYYAEPSPEQRAAGHAGGWQFDLKRGEPAARAAAHEWVDALAERRWVAPHWPSDYGGGGLTPMEQFILRQELARAGTPPVGGPGINMLGPTLIIHGTEEQKQRFLPPTLTGEIAWAQGYSEPGAGSDLASLQTRAVRDGDEYVLSGQKIWTSSAHKADWIFVLARTNTEAPKHRGISFLLMDITTPGISVRPIISAGWEHATNETFYDNVRAPVNQRLGEENRGWYVAMTLLDHERSNIAGAIEQRRALEQLIGYCGSDTGRVRTRASELPAVRAQIVDRYVATEVLFGFSFRIVSMQNAGQVPNYEASTAKLFGSELSQEVQQTGMKAFGLYANIWDPEDPRAPLDARFTQRSVHNISSTIAGGTSEIQRNIIATRGLGLPRG